MHAAGYVQYGRDFIDRFLRHWPTNFRLRVYAEEFVVDAVDSRVEVVDLLDQVSGLREFRRRHAAVAASNGIFGDSYNYRFDAVRFSNKAYVVADAAESGRARYLVWLDADTLTFQDVPSNVVRSILGEVYSMAYLGRFGEHSEAGFLAFRLDAPGIKEFFAALRGVYELDEVFSAREWHDSHIIDCIRMTMAGFSGLKARNMNIHGARHPFVNSAPGLFMDHKKGPTRKKAGRSSVEDYLVPPAWRVNFYGGRYGQLAKIVENVLPETIVEIGAWSGWRAVQMALISLANGRRVHYMGYDVFEQGENDLDAREKNVKPHFKKEEVERLLEILVDLYPAFTYELVVGDTRQTLSPQAVDLVFLDGGHSVETIRHDFSMVCNSGVVVLDDYYEGGVDIDLFGCNKVLSGVPHFLLPVADPVQNGGFTKFAVTGSNTDLVERLSKLF